MTKSGKLYYNDITILKVMAALFITWFHFKWWVPEGMAPLFIGGAIGNCMFFYASGCLLKFKTERYPGEWMAQKVLRVLPSVWVFLVLTALWNTRIASDWHSWIYPTPFWFVNCILCLFLVCFLTKKWLTVGEKDAKQIKTLSRSIIILSTITIIGDVIYYIYCVDHTTVNVDEGGYKFLFFSFLFFLWGYWDQIHTRRYHGNWWSVLGLMAAIGLFFLYKKVGGRYPLLVEWQVLFIPLLLAPVVYFGRCVAAWIVHFEVPERMKGLLSLISNLTLDIYIVQVFIISNLMPLMPLPLNIVVCLIAIGVAGYCNNFLSKLLRKWVLGIRYWVLGNRRNSGN